MLYRPLYGSGKISGSAGPWCGIFGYTFVSLSRTNEVDTYKELL
jgi:hypothetical protein